MAQEMDWDLEYDPLEDIFLLVNSNRTKALENRRLDNVIKDIEVLKRLRRKEYEKYNKGY